MKAYLAMAYAIPTLVVVLFFARYAEHTGAAAISWSLLYFAGTILPIVYARRALRQLDEHGVPPASKLRIIAFYPVIAGGVTMLIALAMLREAALR